MKISEYESQMLGNQELKATVKITGCHDPSEYENDVKFLCWLVVSKNDEKSMEAMKAIHAAAKNGTKRFVGPLKLTVR